MKTRLAALFLLIFHTGFLLAESEGQRAKTAEKYFVAKQFDKAAPLFAQLVSSNPKNFKYNYYYGICLTITAKDKTQALPYLEAALENAKTPEDIYYYYGRAMHLTYHFDEAIRSFTEFNGIVGDKDAARFQTPQLMMMCNSAKKILDTTRNAQILEKIESMSGDFYSKYQFNTGSGKLLTMPDELIKSTQSNSDERPMIFLSANTRVMYYSAISKENGSRDIYRVEKDLDNNWGEPVRLSIEINTTDDELFPSCNPDGRILYFSSRGHNSTGGFDIFKAYYNTVSKTWSHAVNMGSPYNSPDDDYCFVASVSDTTAYFTSQRETGPGALTVYRMRYENTEELPIAINGRFNCIGQPELKTVKITVTNGAENNITASLTSDPVTGAYALELPGPGTYNFKVEAEGYTAHTEQVTFAEFSDNIYVQDIFLSRNEKGAEDLAISNRRLTEAGLLDDNAMANVDENGNPAAGITSADLQPYPGSTGTSGSSVSGKTMNTTSGPSLNNDQAKVPSITGTQFKVQIGAFRKHTREIVQKRLEKKADKNMMSSYDDKTWLRFFMGGEANYQSAKNLKTILIQAGFKDAFIVAFRNGKPMNLSEAIRAEKQAAMAAAKKAATGTNVNLEAVGNTENQ